MVPKPKITGISAFHNSMVIKAMAKNKAIGINIKIGFLFIMLKV